MRLRFTVLAAAITAVAVASIPSIASAAPHHDRALTIHLVPPSITAGDQVDIIGQLEGADSANQVIRLYHRINPNQRFTLISTTRTDATGRYEFQRADGVVQTNRSWFTRGPALSHSRTVHEHVSAAVTISPDPGSGGAVIGDTRHPLTFTGHVSPSHAGQLVRLQVSDDGGQTWQYVKSARLDANSDYSISQAFRVAGPLDVRVVLPADPRNDRSYSDDVSVQIQQVQVTGFSIQSSDQVVTEGTGATISGIVDNPNTTTPDAGAQVSLYARGLAAGPYTLAQTATTGSDGGYSFNVQPSINQWYQVRLTATPTIHSAQLFQGVRDVVSLAGPSTATVDQHVAFTGNVAPDKTGHLVYLQKLGADGAWHTVEVSRVGAGSNYAFGWTFGAAGTKQFRTRITGGPANVGAVSAAVTVTVSQPPLNTLPTG
ncbi:MAG: hypothetical protein JOZ07_11230 [Solirubrobacterales bacterium]|nr:hypothetical protein [Solirubrobacterales bacterium]